MKGQESLHLYFNLHISVLNIVVVVTVELIKVKIRFKIFIPPSCLHGKRGLLDCSMTMVLMPGLFEFNQESTLMLMFFLLVSVPEDCARYGENVQGALCQHECDQ